MSWVSMKYPLIALSMSWHCRWNGLSMNHHPTSVFQNFFFREKKNKKKKNLFPSSTILPIFIVTLSINLSRHKLVLKVSLLIWVFLCRESSCWVLLSRMSLWRLSLCWMLWRHLKTMNINKITYFQLNLSISKSIFPRQKQVQYNPPPQLKNGHRHHIKNRLINGTYSQPCLFLLLL